MRLGVPIKGTLKQVDGIEIFPRQDELGADEFGNAIRAPLGIHRANMHRYWFEDAGSNLEDQMAFLRGVKRLTRKDLETFTEGLSIPESIGTRPPIQPVSYPPWNNGAFQILQHVAVRVQRSGNYWTRCPSCAKEGRDRAGDNLAISIADPRFYKCWAGCTRRDDPRRARPAYTSTELSLTEEVLVQESRFTTLTRRGLMLPAEIREEIRKTGIRCRPQVEIVHQDRANQWKLRAEESGGAVAVLGHYVGFLNADGTPMSWLHRVQNLLPNGIHAVVIESELVRVESSGTNTPTIC